MSSPERPEKWAWQETPQSSPQGCPAEPPIPWIFWDPKNMVMTWGWIINIYMVDDMVLATCQ